LRKLQSAPAFQFKGTGWYVTDYAKKNSGGSTAKSDSGSKESGKNDKSEKSGSAQSESGKSESAKSEKSGASGDSKPSSAPAATSSKDS
jgi:hypothetical protein